MLRPSWRHGRTALLGALAGGVLLAGGLAVRLWQGPIGLDAVRPVLERWLGQAAPGGRARVGAAELVWFRSAHALGLRLHDVTVTDRRGRPVLRARTAEAGLAAASLAGLRPAPGRLAARDFFAAVSVSPQGRYALGYDAAGPPPRGGPDDLWGLFGDLTGPARTRRPLSQLRELDLERGVVALRQNGGELRWTGRIAAARLEKASGRLSARLDLTVGAASLQARAGGAVGLEHAALEARVAGLDPARLFPSVGPTRALSALDAVLQGEGAVRWAASAGLQAGRLSLEAGPGELRLGSRREPFAGGELRTVYEPRTRQVVLQAARLRTSSADLDLGGRFWLSPQGAGAPARLEVALASRASRLALAPGAVPQPIEAFSLRAAYTPRTGRLELGQVSARVAGAPLNASGVFQRPRPGQSWGVKLRGRIDGFVEPRQVTALWPDGLNDDARAWLDGHVRAGRLGQAAFSVDLPPGAVADGRPRPNEAINLRFAFDGAAVLPDETIPLVEQGRGAGVLQGDRFDLTVASARMQGVALSEGLVQLPRLIGEGKRLEVYARARGDARQILQIVDGASGGAPTRRGLAPSRLSGAGDVLFHVGRTLREGPDDYWADYDGVIRGAALREAVLGLTLRSQALKLSGTMDRLSARGRVRLGPYRGPLEFAARFPDGRPTTQKAVFDGVLDASGLGLSGPAGGALPFVARFESRGDAGRGVIRSRAFDGKTVWRLGPRGEFSGQGVLDVAALRAAGAPVGPGVPDRMPARLLLRQGPDGWTGSLQADAYSGSIRMPEGPDFRLTYAAQLSPAEAGRIGLQPRPAALSLDLSGGEERGSLTYGAGPWLGQVSWAPGRGARTQYRWRTTFSPADLHALGLPAGIEPRTSLPVDLILTPTGEGWTGAGQVAGGDVRIEASAPDGGHRRVLVSGALQGAALAGLGLSPEGMISGPAAFRAELDAGAGGVGSGRIVVDLQQAAVSAPFIGWTKTAGRPLRLTSDFDRRPDGVLEASSIRGEGAGFALAASGFWRPGAEGLLRVDSAKLQGAFSGAMDLATGPDGRKLTVRARYLDARPLIQGGGRARLAADPGVGSGGQGAPLRLDVRVSQVRVSEAGTVRNVRMAGVWGGGDQRRLDLEVLRDDGGALVSLRLIPDAAGMAIQGRVSDVGETALQLFGRRSFRGGTASVDGRLAPGGADLHVEMRKVRLVQAPEVARILTIGSLRGLADVLNGQGIEFAEVVAPVGVRGSRLEIGRARATGPAMGITTEGVIDFDAGTVDLSGGVAPSYVLNSAVGNAPVIGRLLVSRKGEGVFGLTYTARGAFSAPKVSVNPLSIAAPGILRRLFEGRTAEGGRAGRADG